LKRGFFDFCKGKIFFKENHFSILLIFNHLQIHFARVRSIFAKRLFLERSKFFFSKSFAVLKNGFIIVMYSKAKQTANKYGEKRIKK